MFPKIVCKCASFFSILSSNVSHLSLCALNTLISRNHFFLYVGAYLTRIGRKTKRHRGEEEKTFLFCFCYDAREESKLKYQRLRRI